MKIMCPRCGSEYLEVSDDQHVAYNITQVMDNDLDACSEEEDVCQYTCSKCKTVFYM